MLKKFIKIKNTGRFKDFNYTGDTELKKLNVIYGENGAGKTTLVTILRSLKENKQNILIGRKTLGATEDQQILLLVEPEGQIKFNKDGWDKNLSKVEIYDSAFITDNVHSGNYVDIEHKRNLHLWAIGEEGVKLANRIAEIDSESRAITSKINEVKGNVKNKIKGQTSFEDYVLLKEDKEIEDKIKNQETILESSKNIDYVKEKSSLEEISELEVNIENIRTIIGKTYADLTAEASKKVKDHINQNLDEKGEAWLEQGNDYIKNNVCPFCNQDLKDVDIIEYYKHYFSEVYKKFKKEILDNINEIKNAVSKNYIESVKSALKVNGGLLKDWNKILNKEFKLDKVDVDKYKEDYKQLYNKIIELLDLKANNPIEQVDLNDLESIIKQFSKCQSEIEVYNKNVKDVNGSIKSFKEQPKGTSDEEQLKLDSLYNIKSRYSEEVKGLIDEWGQLNNEKDGLNEEKQTNKEKLNGITENILNLYGEGINNYLFKCGANFQLFNSRVKYTGGKACIEYQLELNHSHIDLGRADTPDEIPSFKNTLSEGDKSALAFAFFLARIEKDPDIENKIVVIDDPISSMDIHRKDTTAHALYEISAKALQTLVFTHSPEFAKLIWDKDKTSNKRCLRTEIESDSCKIIEWNIETIGVSNYFHHYFLLSEYVLSGKGDRKSIAQSIRPLLEGNMRFRFPQTFKNGHWLGEYIEMIRNSSSDSKIYVLKEQLSELEEINDYSKKFHHDQNENWTENLSNINLTSLKAHAERAIKLCTG